VAATARDRTIGPIVVVNDDEQLPAVAATILRRAGPRPVDAATGIADSALEAAEHAFGSAPRSMARPTVAHWPLLVGPTAKRDAGGGAS
jgi:hypothetical protein